jgi:hypothetical protein
MTGRGVTLITPTGDRPVAFRLCEKYVARQRFDGPTEWIVVDDGVVPTRCRLGQQYVRRAAGEPRRSSLARNLRCGLDRAAYDRILVIEDDDWYAPQYVDVMARLLDEFDLVGQGNPLYYNPLHRLWRSFTNATAATLAATGFTRTLVEAASACCAPGEPTIDNALWALDVRRYVFTDARLCVGMKGLPGRAGYFLGHRPAEDDPAHALRHHDPDGRVLRRLLGEDAETYLGLFVGAPGRPDERHARQMTRVRRSQ